MTCYGVQGDAHKKMGIPSFRVQIVLDLAKGRFMLSPRYPWGTAEELVKELGDNAVVLFDPE